jgi:hypothetical protein
LFFVFLVLKIISIHVYARTDPLTGAAHVSVVPSSIVWSEALLLAASALSRRATAAGWADGTDMSAIVRAGFAPQLVSLSSGLLLGVGWHHLGLFSIGSDGQVSWLFFKVCARVCFAKQ